MIWIFPIIGGVLGAWRPVFGYCFVILVWPAYLLRTELFGIPSTALELSLYAALFGTAIWWLRSRAGWHWVRMTRWSWVLLGAWVLAWAIATGLAADRQAALGAGKAWLIDPLLFAAGLAFCVRNERGRRLIIQAALASGLIVALAGLMQIGWFRESLQEGRLSSFFAPVANYASMFLGPLVVLCGSLLLQGWLQRVWWWAFGVMAAALILTLSFGAYLAAALGGVVAWWFLTDKKLKRKLMTAGLIIMIIGAAGLTQTKNFSQHFDFSGRSSGSVRQQIWVTAWALGLQHPIFGVGPNNFEPAYRAELPKHYFPPLEWLVAQPHNLYLALWLETGLLGLMAFLGLFVYHLRLLARNFFPNVDQRAVAVSSLAALVTILAHGLVDTPYFKNDLSLEFMFLAVLPWLGAYGISDRRTLAQTADVKGNTG